MAYERREGHLKRPHIYPESNVYTDPVEVKITNRWYHKATIHYTLDGSHPTLQSPKYHHPFMICEDTVVKAVAFHAGKHSDVSKVVYGFSNPYYCEKPCDGPDEVSWDESK